MYHLTDYTIKCPSLEPVRKQQYSNANLRFEANVYFIVLYGNVDLDGFVVFFSLFFCLFLQ